MGVTRRSGAWQLVAAISAGVVLTVPRIAAAEDRPVVVSLTMDPSPLERCGGAAALRQLVGERLHRSAFVPDDEADVAFAITDVGTTNDGSWLARIAERDRGGAELGRRDVPLPADDCSKALDTLAVVLAIMVGPTRTTTDPPRNAPTNAPAEPVREPAPTPPSAPKARPPHPRPAPRWKAGALAGVVTGSGILPGLAWGLEAGVVIAPPVKNLSAIVRGAFWPAQATGTRPPADIDRFGGSLLGCYELVRSPSVRDAFGLAGCAGVDVSRIEARSENLTRPSNSSVLVGLLGELRLGYRLALRENLIIEPGFAVQIEGVAQRDRFTYRDLSGRELTLLEPAPVAFETGIGVAVHFL